MNTDTDTPTRPQVNGTDGSYGGKNDNCKVSLGVPSGSGGNFQVREAVPSLM